MFSLAFWNFSSNFLSRYLIFFVWLIASASGCSHRCQASVRTAMIACARPGVTMQYRVSRAMLCVSLSAGVMGWWSICAQLIG